MRGRRQYIGAAADNDGMRADFAEGAVLIVVAQWGQESDGGGHGGGLSGCRDCARFLDRSPDCNLNLDQGTDFNIDFDRDRGL